MQATLVFDGNGIRFPAVTTFGLTTPSDLEDLEVIADLFSDCHNAIASSAVNLASIEYKVGPVASGPTYILPVNRAGSRNANAVPSNTCYLVRKLVEGVSGRQHGRSYWPGPAEAEIGPNGGLIEGLQVTVQNALNTLYVELITLGVTPQVFPTISSDPRAVAIFGADGFVATQRRRLRR